MRPVGPTGIQRPRRYPDRSWPDRVGLVGDRDAPAATGTTAHAGGADGRRSRAGRGLLRPRGGRGGHRHHPGRRPVAGDRPGQQRATGPADIADDAEFALAGQSDPDRFVAEVRVQGRRAERAVHGHRVRRDHQGHRRRDLRRRARRGWPRREEGDLDGQGTAGVRNEIRRQGHRRRVRRQHQADRRLDLDGQPEFDGAGVVPTADRQRRDRRRRRADHPDVLRADPGQGRGAAGAEGDHRQGRDRRHLGLAAGRGRAGQRAEVLVRALPAQGLLAGQHQGARRGQPAWRRLRQRMGPGGHRGRLQDRPVPGRQGRDQLKAA